MTTDEFDYPLPPELIAQVPAQRRDESRLMVVDRRSGKIEHTVFRELPAHVPEGARFFRNSAAVFKGPAARPASHRRRGRVPAAAPRRRQAQLLVPAQTR